MIEVWNSPAIASALPWPKRWSASAGLKAIMIAKRFTAETRKSSDESANDPNKETEPENHQAYPLAAIKVIATMTEAIAPRRISRFCSE